MKRILALLMVLVFCLGAFVTVDTQAFAADYYVAPLMPTVDDDDVVVPGVVGGTDTQILASYSDYVVAVDPSNATSVATFAEILSSAGAGSISTEEAKEIMEIISASTSDNASVLVVEKNAVLSVEAIQATVAETGSSFAIVSTNSASSSSNDAGDFVVVVIAAEDASSLTKSVSMDINVTTTKMGGSDTAIDINSLTKSTEADTVVFNFSSTGNFGTTLSITSQVSMNIAKNSDGSYPALSIYSTSGDQLGSADISGLASSETGKITIPITISDSVVAKSTLSAFSIAGVRVAYASTQYAEVTGGVAADGSIEVTSITIVSDTIVPVIISTLSSDELFVSASTDAGDTTLSGGTTTATDDSNGISAWVWMIVAVAVLGLVLVAVLVVKKKQA